MRCVKCGSFEDKVIDSRMSKDGVSIRRRRECIDCGCRFTTYEHIERMDFRVIKRDGGREPFDRQKLFRGILKACEKRPVGIELLDKAIDSVVNELHADGQRETDSSTIGMKVMIRLKDIDSVAYVRYASVYRQFQNVGEFIEEIASMEKGDRLKEETKAGLLQDRH